MSKLFQFPINWKRVRYSLTKAISPTRFFFGLRNTHTPPYIRAVNNSNLWTFLILVFQLPSLIALIDLTKGSDTLEKSLFNATISTLVALILWFVFFQIHSFIFRTRMKILWCWAPLYAGFASQWPLLWQALALLIGTTLTLVLDKVTKTHYFHPAILSGALLTLLKPCDLNLDCRPSWFFISMVCLSSVWLACMMMVHLRIVLTGLIGLLIACQMTHSFNPNPGYYFCLVFIAADPVFAPSRPSSQYIIGFFYTLTYFSIAQKFGAIYALPFSLILCQAIGLYLDRLSIFLMRRNILMPRSMKGAQKYVQSNIAE